MIHTLPINRFFLPQIIKYFNYKNYTEVGTDKGEFIDYILKSTDVTGTAIDPYELCYLTERVCFGVNSDDIVINNEHQLRNKEHLLQRMSLHGERFKLIREFSHLYGRTIPDSSLDIVFVDGDHSHEGVLKDLKIYYNKVKDGGLLCGHDYDGDFGPSSSVVGVKSAVDEFVKDHNLVCYVTEPNFYYASSLSNQNYPEGIQSFFIFKNMSVDINDLIGYCYCNLTGNHIVSCPKFKKEAKNQLQKRMKAQFIKRVGLSNFIQKNPAVNSTRENPQINDFIANET